jgi:RNA polymerase-binding transcription factor DksA
VSNENQSVAHIEKTLDDVATAMRRLADGTYRRCVSCGAEIAREVLESDPLYTSCAAHPQMGDVQ